MLALPLGIFAIELVTTRRAVWIPRSIEIPKTLTGLGAARLRFLHSLPGSVPGGKQAAELVGFDCLLRLAALPRDALHLGFGPGHNIDKVVNVYHGPVRYQDQSGVLETLEDTVDLFGAKRAWFTKGTEFSGQREYRFAVSTLGALRKNKRMITVSDEIRRLVAEIPEGYEGTSSRHYS